MLYIKHQNKNIRKIVAGHQKWYRADSGIWGERYMREKRDILTPVRNKNEARIIMRHLPRKCRTILDAPCGYGRIANILSSHGFDVTG